MPLPDGGDGAFFDFARKGCLLPLHLLHSTIISSLFRSLLLRRFLAPNLLRYLLAFNYDVERFSRIKAFKFNYVRVICYNNRHYHPSMKYISELRVPSGGYGLITTNPTEKIQRAMKKLDDMPTLSGSRSHAKHTMPVSASTNPSAVRKMQRAWNRASRLVGGSPPWNGPTCTRWGLQDHTGFCCDPEWILTGPGIGSVLCELGIREFRFRPRLGGSYSAFSMSREEMEVGESTISTVSFSPSACFSSSVAISSLYRMRKNAARKEMIAARI
ncbi:hypothetical protein BDZ97DRAFT_484002 [Flammula alnicola]|nr:hypothetical protein BDZ97DRAFT_484002 [Flammula alnicola]